jgi:hypothetical protein
MDKMDIKMDTKETAKVDVRSCPPWGADSFNNQVFGVSNVHLGTSKDGHFVLLESLPDGHVAVSSFVHLVHLGGFLRGF